MTNHAENLRKWISPPYVSTMDEVCEYQDEVNAAADYIKQLEQDAVRYKAQYDAYNKRIKQLEQAIQDAPHDFACSRTQSITRHTATCDCWKSDLTAPDGAKQEK